MTNLANHPQVAAALARFRGLTGDEHPQWHIVGREDLDALLAAIVSALAEGNEGLDFEAAVQAAANSGEWDDPEAVAYRLREDHTDHDTFGYNAALDAQHRAIVGALRAKLREFCEVAGEVEDDEGVSAADLALMVFRQREDEYQKACAAIKASEGLDANAFPSMNKRIWYAALRAKLAEVVYDDGAEMADGTKLQWLRGSLGLPAFIAALIRRRRDAETAETKLAEAEARVKELEGELKLVAHEIAAQAANSPAAKALDKIFGFGGTP